MDGNEAKKPRYKTPNRQGEYARIAKLLPKAIKKLSELLESKNEAIRLGAINKILDKGIPDLKAIELSGRDGKDIPFTINIIPEKKIPEENKSI